MCTACSFLSLSTLLTRVSPEELFLDLAVHEADTSTADILAITTGLDVNSLYEVTRSPDHQVSSRVAHGAKTIPPSCWLIPFHYSKQCHMRRSQSCSSVPASCERQWIFNTHPFRIIPVRILSRLIASYLIVPYNAVSHRILPYVLYHIAWFHVASYRTMTSYRIVSRRIVSCRVARIVPYHVFYCDSRPSRFSWCPWFLLVRDPNKSVNYSGQPSNHWACAITSMRWSSTSCPRYHPLTKGSYNIRSFLQPGNFCFKIGRDRHDKNCTNSSHSANWRFLAKVIGREQNSRI